MRKFSPGQEVVCIDDQSRCGLPQLAELYGQILVKCRRYVIREVLGDGCVRLVGIYRQCRDEPYYADRFELVDARSTEAGVAILRKVARDASQKRRFAATT